VSIFTVETIILLLVAVFIAWEIDLEKPKPYSLGNGDTLMVKKLGYGFCPTHCNVDHFHIGHFKKYNCKKEICTHITINQD
tara:strand:+ start:161 stop:403 length:243 start_codon:yes stop_codon:yes gene_type:complete